MTISAVLSDCDTIDEVAAWSRAHTSWLRQFLVLKHGIPSEDTFLQVFRLSFECVGHAPEKTVFSRQFSN